MGFQQSVNQAINIAGLVKTAQGATYQKHMQEKYGIGSPLSSQILDPSETFDSIETKQKAYDHLKDRLEFMRGEAELTDLKERQAKILGLFPTKESKEIRQEGLARKQENIFKTQSELKEMLHKDIKPTSTHTERPETEEPHGK